MPENTIHELTAAIASGDTEAFGRFYGNWFQYMYDQARRATGRDEATCLDIVHDSMMKVIRAMPPFEGEGHLRSWLRVVVINCSYDRLRAEARREARERQAAPADEPASDTESLRERLCWLRSQLARMEEPAARLIIMRHRFGWTLQQIGNTVGLSPGAVDSRLRRAVASLRRKGIETFQQRGEP